MFTIGKLSNELFVELTASPNQPKRLVGVVEVYSDLYNEGFVRSLRN